MSFFSVQSDRGDVEDLMTKVSVRLSELERSGQLGNQQTAILPSGGPSISLDDQIRTLHAQWMINPNEIIHSSRPRIGEVIRRFQRLVRRATFWYTVPLLDQVSAFNGGTVRALAGLRSQQAALQDELDRLAAVSTPRTGAATVEQPEGEASDLRQLVASLSMRLSAVEAKLQALDGDSSDE